MIVYLFKYCFESIHYLLRKFCFSYRSMLLELREDTEIRDFQQYFSIIFKGCVEETGDSKENIKQNRRKR